VITISFEVGAISGTNSDQSGEGGAGCEKDSSLSGLRIVAFVYMT